MQYPLLVLLVGWLVVQVLLVGAYFTALAVVERGNVARVWLVIAGGAHPVRVREGRMPRMPPLPVGGSVRTALRRGRYADRPESDGQVHQGTSICRVPLLLARE
jgi:hypothetical protein